jgi:hypothetical protein
VQKRHQVLASALAAAGFVAVASGQDAAYAVATPGQSLYNDYGQSTVEVNVEISTEVNANLAVRQARVKVTTFHNAVLYRLRVQATARTAYLAAVRSGNAARIRTTKATYVAAIAATNKAKSVEAAAITALNRTIASVTATVRAKHYRPRDGVWTGAVSQYFIPGVGLEPIQVRITVYGGNVSDVSVPQFVNTGESAGYNARALPILMQETMAAHNTAAVAAVSGASLTSGSFKVSLQSALVAAGFKG